MKIMVCHDGSELAENALERTIELFKPQRPEIILVIVVEGPLDASMRNEEIFERWRSDRHELLMKTAKEIAERGLDVDAILAVGDARKMIIEAVDDKNPDILVVARESGGLIDQMTSGSVAAFLVRHAPCPVLVYN
ncbi:MAG: universal stress protein [Deltaproteobacteria bacterium]|nr:universal stress protein [Deltaproteobacteria bacterium]